MTDKNVEVFNTIIAKVSNKQLRIVFDGVPNYVADLVEKGRDYKRIGQYEEAFEAYVQAISICGCIYTEVGRMFAKTLCAMNDYDAAFWLLLVCANAKWETSMNVPKTGNKYFDEMNEKRFSNMPTACAADFYELRDCVKQAAQGDLKPLFERTKAVSGNQNYKNVKSDYEIVQMCLHLCQVAKL